MKYHYIISFVIISVCLFILGCGEKNIIYPDPSENQFDGAFVSRQDSIQVGGDQYTVDYGTITVLENRRVENSRFIELPVICVHSSAEEPDNPIFYFSGGPGMSNMNSLGSMWYLLPKHDIVLVGYRGIDGSSILDCPEVAKAMKGKGDLLGDASMKNIERAWQASAQRFTEAGVDINGYTILDVIEDNELVRKTLGYDQINLKSGSYGTRVAYFYSVIHPEVIHRSVMSAVNPPGHFVWDPYVADEQLHELSGLWVKTDSSISDENYVYNIMKKVLYNLPKRWLIFPINAGKMKAVTFSLLWNRNTVPLVIDAFIRAEQGDPSGLYLMSLAYDFVMPNMFVWGDLASKAVSADYDPNEDYIHHMMPDELPLGAPMSQLLWGPLQYGDAWSIKSIPDKFKEPQFSDVQTLLLSGSMDLGTPAQFATDELLPYLKNGQQIILSECFHFDIEWADPQNVQRIISSFYSTGTPDMSLNQYVPVDFSVNWGFNRLAKVGLGVSVLVLIIIIIVIVWLIRIVRKLLNKYRKK